MDDLCQYTYEVCRRSLSVENIGSWLHFVENGVQPSANGAASPNAVPTVFGHYAQRLREDVFHFLVVTLPEVLEVRQQDPQPDAASGTTGRDVLLQVYAQVPFETFKAAVESPTFNIGSFFFNFLEPFTLSSTISLLPRQDPIKPVSSSPRAPSNCVSKASPEETGKKRWCWHLEAISEEAPSMSHASCASDLYGRSIRSRLFGKSARLLLHASLTTYKLHTCLVEPTGSEELSARENMWQQRGLLDSPFLTRTGRCHGFFIGRFDMSHPLFKVISLIPVTYS